MGGTFAASIIKREAGRAAPGHARESVVRGQALRSLFSALGVFFTQAELAEILARLPPEVHAVARGELSGTTWYPISWYASIHAAAREVKEAGPELSRELGREARTIDARGLYKFVLRFLSPESLVKHADRVAALYVDGLRITMSPVLVESSAQRSVIFRFDGAYGFEDAIWQDVLGSMEVLLEMAGGHRPRAIAYEGGGSSPWMEGEACWTP